MRHPAAAIKPSEASRDVALAWRDYDPDRDEVPPAPGLPPVSTLKKCHRSRHRGPALLATALAFAYGLLSLLWVTLH